VRDILMKSAQRGTGSAKEEINRGSRVVRDILMKNAQRGTSSAKEEINRGPLRCARCFNGDE